MRSIVFAFAILAACGKGDGKSSKSGGDKEAQIQLDNLGNLVKKAFFKEGAFPTMTLGPTPSTACCDQPDHACAPSAADWGVGAATAGGWNDLHFKMTDGPFHFQYSYTSDGKTFTATAVGDPACDGHKVTYTANGTIKGGEPAITVSGP
jgi:hypothetical protein